VTGILSDVDSVMMNLFVLVEGRAGPERSRRVRSLILGGRARM